MGVQALDRLTGSEPVRVISHPRPATTEKGRPGQRYRHGWIPIEGGNLDLGEALHQDEITRRHGELAYNHEFAPGAYVELSKTGRVHIDLATADKDRYHVVADMDRETAGSLVDDLQWAADESRDIGDRPPDPVNGLMDWRGEERTGLVGYDPDGTVRVGWPAGGGELNVFDLHRDEANRLATYLDEMTYVAD